MTDFMSNPTFTSLPLDLSQTVSWIHIGDTHLTRSGEQNEIDLGRIVDEVNAVYAKGGIDFVFVPGDIADDGSAVAYQAFRRHLDRLQLPWVGIVGDHDVHDKSFENFERHISPDLYSAFTVGRYRFIRLNAFSVPKPDSFTVDDEQLQWLERELRQSERNDQRVVLLLHCYPNDLKQGGERLKELLRGYPVVLVDMGHTHYNEVSNDGTILYTATRSTGQIEEGPVGYSVATLDRGTFSWHFVPLGAPSLVAITHPADERLLSPRTSSPISPSAIQIHAKTWFVNKVVDVHIHTEKFATELTSIDGIFWTGTLDCRRLPIGTVELRAVAHDETGTHCSSSIRLRLGEWPTRDFALVDQENAIGEWLERGLLGTQLGPNKNGKKW